MKNVQLEKPLPIFHRNRKFHKFDFAFIQLAIERNRCPYIDHFFNELILTLVSIQRAKFYQESYHNYSTLFCFHNDIFMCICDRFRLTQCFFGNVCRFTTSQYSISFDAPSGPILAVEKGLCLNTMTIILFIVWNKCQFYIIVSSILGTCYLIILTLKLISIVLLPYLSNRLNCIFIEYFLKCLLTMVDWLNTCVLLERV